MSIQESFYEGLDERRPKIEKELSLCFELLGLLYFPLVSSCLRDKWGLVLDPSYYSLEG